MIGEWPEMSEYGWPVTAVAAPHCATCGDHQQEQHRGHEFEPLPWPKPFGEPQREMKLQGGLDLQNRAVMTATLEKVTVKAWAWVDDRPRVLEERQRELEHVTDVLLARSLCPHAELSSANAVARILGHEPTPLVPLPKPVAYAVDVRVWCADCGERFVFKGPMKVGLQPTKPTVDVEGTMLSAPLRPLLAPEGFGNGLPGYGVRIRG